MVKILDQIVANIMALPPGEEVDVNNVTLRLALDITGMVGFAKDFGTTRSFSDAGTDELFYILQSSASLVLDFKFKSWKVSSLCILIQNFATPDMHACRWCLHLDQGTKNAHIFESLLFLLVSVSPCISNLRLPYHHAILAHSL